MKESDKLQKASLHCYRMLYANATPPASFDALMESAIVNDRGQKEIPFLDYQIPKEIFDEIVMDTIKMYKIKTPRLVSEFKFVIYLGCSPRFS
jgi:hypothetical protein